MLMNLGQRAATMPASAGPPTWSTWRQCGSVVTHSANLRRTLSISLAVGTVFCLMNQLPAVLAGQVTSLLVLKAGLTYLVPFCTSNYGILAASRRSSVREEVPPPVGGASQEAFA